MVPIFAFEGVGWLQKVMLRAYLLVEGWWCNKYMHA
jgi:hypothetical protein